MPLSQKRAPPSSESNEQTDTAVRIPRQGANRCETRSAAMPHVQDLQKKLLQAGPAGSTKFLSKLKWMGGLQSIPTWMRDDERTPAERSPEAAEKIEALESEHDALLLEEGVPVHFDIPCEERRHMAVFCLRIA